MRELPFVAVVRAGFATMVLATLAMLSFPSEVGPLPRGMHTPVLALELARTSAEVEAMFGAHGSDERRAWVRAFDRGNTVDFAMLVAYGAMLSLYARVLAQRTGQRYLRLVALLAYVAPLADALENMRLLAITSALGGDYRAELASLAWFTGIKWAALALCFAGLLPAAFSRGSSGRLVGVLFVFPIVVTPFGLQARGPWAEAMLVMVGLSFVAIFVHAVAEHRRALR